MAAPVGPVAALCISVTLRRGKAHGMIAGFGAALADALFAAVAVFGFAGVSAIVDGQSAWIRLVAGLVLAIVGIRRLRRPIQLLDRDVADPAKSKLQSSFLGPLLLTLGNPATILSFAAVLGALGFDGVDIGPAGSALVTMGVFTGAMLWWAGVTWVAGRLRHRTQPKALARFDRVVTTIILVFAASLALSGILPFLSRPR